MNKYHKYYNSNAVIKVTTCFINRQTIQDEVQLLVYDGTLFYPSGRFQFNQAYSWLSKTLRIDRIKLPINT